MTNSWPGGFQAEVTVRNTGTAALTGWTVGWTFAGGQTITQLWNGTHTQTGAAVTVRDAAGTARWRPDAETTFGFLGSGRVRRIRSRRRCPAAEGQRQKTATPASARIKVPVVRNSATGTAFPARSRVTSSPNVAPIRTAMPSLTASLA